MTSGNPVVVWAITAFASGGMIFMGVFALALYMFRRKDRYSSAIEENELLNSLHKSKSDFLNDLNHELRTPLSIITSGVSYANRLLERNGDIEQVRETLDAARDEALHIGRMLDGMTTMAALSDKVDNRERLNLAGVILCVAEGFRRRLESYGVELRITIEPDLPDVFVEREQFGHVILNLMTNAVRYTHFGAVTVSVALSHPRVVVTVADTGEGIAPMLLPTLFESGKSGESGRGNGLYVCKSVVEAHGGVITVESELHIGTKVTFTVPVYGGQEAGHGKKRDPKL